MNAGQPVPTDSNGPNAVTDALQTMLCDMPEFAAPIREVSRKPSAYRSSFALEEITVTWSNGRSLIVMFKDFDWQLLTPAGQRAKPLHLYDPLREIEVYRRALASRSLGTARYYGAVVDPAKRRYWLFMEKAPGTELYQIGELHVWCEVARWLARLHHDESIRAAAESSFMRPHLLRWDAALFQSWIDRAVEFVALRRGSQAATPLTALAGQYDKVARFLAALPPAFIHGEFYASNVLVDTAHSPPRVCAVDWELAATGPAVLDLAALVSGTWTDSQRMELIAAYQSGLPAANSWAGDLAALSHAVDFARLHLAVQWLGWSPDWTPPAAHAQDWMANAERLGKKLGLM
jgi:Ser/Thr protein kinase RdoA (MazF antagonist)